MRIAVALILVALGLPLLATADLVVPIDSVEQFVNIRAEPNDKSDVIGRLYQGDNIRLLESVDGWHEIEIETDFNGYISADWSKVISKAELENAALRARQSETTEVSEEEIMAKSIAALDLVPESPAEEIVEEAPAEDVVEALPIANAVIQEPAAEEPVEAE